MQFPTFQRKSIFKEHRNANAASFLEAATCPLAVLDHSFCLLFETDERVSLRCQFVPISTAAFPTLAPAL